jgi:hypothetical protein
VINYFIQGLKYFFFFLLNKSFIQLQVFSLQKNFLDKVFNLRVYVYGAVVIRFQLLLGDWHSSSNLRMEGVHGSELD